MDGLTPSTPPLVSKVQLLTLSGRIILPTSFASSAGIREGYCELIDASSCLLADDLSGVAFDWCARGFLNIPIIYTSLTYY